MESSAKAPTRRCWKISESHVVAIAPPIVKELNIDETVYFEEKVTADGCILLKPRRLQ